MYCFKNFYVKIVLLILFGFVVVYSKCVGDKIKQMYVDIIFNFKRQRLIGRYYLGKVKKILVIVKDVKGERF